MAAFKIIINRKPVPASRPRVSKFGTYYSKTYNTYKKILKSDLQAIIYKNKLNIILKDVPLVVKIYFYLPFPKSYSKKKKQEIRDNNYFHLIKPDLDNLEKSVLDGLNELIYNDDSQITDLSSSKRYTDNSVGYTEILLQDARELL